MDILSIIIIFGVGIALALGVLFLRGFSYMKLDNTNEDNNDRLSTLVSSQRDARMKGEEHDSDGNLAKIAAESGDLSEKRSFSGKMPLEKRLYYAGLDISPQTFRLLQVVAGLILVILIYTFLPQEVKLPLAVSSLTLTYMISESIINKKIDKKVKSFDDDYPVLLMSYVSLLKTGMNTMYGLEAAADGLDPLSRMRAEVKILVEKLKIGMSEESSIGSFAEEIAHPEIELFVQSLLLSRKVGGQLSHTLERLAKQVRKRQQFKQQAVSSVAMERGSIIIIAVIMSGLISFLGFKNYELVKGAIETSQGLSITGWSIFMIIHGIVWSRVITNIKI